MKTLRKIFGYRQFEDGSSTETDFQNNIDEEGCGAVFAAIKFVDSEFFA